MKGFKLLLLSAMMAGTATAASAQSANITYNGTDSLAGYNVLYSITTNGAIGRLALTDIVSSVITFTPGTNPLYADKGPYTDFNTFYFSNTDNFGNTDGPVPVSATATDLLFDFTNDGGANFCAGPLCYALAGKGISDNDGVVYNHSDADGPFGSREIDDGDRTESKLAAGSYVKMTDSAYSFARADAVTGAVPEPASWAMMVLGVGAAGYAMRRRQKVAVKVAYAA